MLNLQSYNQWNAMIRLGYHSVQYFDHNKKSTYSVRICAHKICMTPPCLLLKFLDFFVNFVIQNVEIPGLKLAILFLLKKTNS